MFSAMRKRIQLTPATAIAVVALVFAMTGGAYAAKKFLITSTKQISPSVLKSLKGAAGKNGAPGPAGPAGPAGAGTAGAGGPQGPAGAAGAKGENGAPGTPGLKGEKGEKGAKGENGTTGFTATLPGGKTETGTWAFGLVTEAAAPGFNGQIRVPISFNIPLAAKLTAAQVHYINPAGKEINGEFEEVEPTQCGSGLGAGVNAENPHAAPGNLCVYATSEANALISSEFIDTAEEAPGASTSGAVLLFLNSQAEAKGIGTWAVTAAEE